MTTKKEKESMPATETFTFKVRGIVKDVVRYDNIVKKDGDVLEKRGLVIAQKGGDIDKKYHPTILVTYIGDKGVAIDNGQGIEEGDEIETTYTPTVYSYERDGEMKHIDSNSGRSITIINKASSLFGGSAEDDLPF